MKNLLSLTLATIACLGIAQLPAIALTDSSPSHYELTEQGIDFDIEAAADTILFAFAFCQCMVLIKLGELD